MNTQDGVPVEIDGERVYLGGSTLGSLKRTLRNHDFQQLSFNYRLELYEQAKVGIVQNSRVTLEVNCSARLPIGLLQPPSGWGWAPI